MHTGVHGQVDVVMELLDYTGDTLVFSEVLSSGAKHAETEGFVLPYTIAFSVATLASLISLIIKAQFYVKQLRKRRADAQPLWLEIRESFSLRQQRIEELNEKLAETKKVEPFSLLLFSPHSEPAFV